jgi:hypothetical protein
MMLPDRFEAKYTPEPTSGCWLWTGATTRDGYGNYALGRRFVGAHRVAYLLKVGPIPDGMQIDHLCRVRHCVNPAHMEVVTARENVLRGVSFAAVNAAKTRCPKGHEYTEDNIEVTPSGGRRCRRCREARRTGKPTNAQGLAARTHCMRGHEFTAENTRILRSSSRKGTSRACKQCMRDLYAAKKGGQ